MKKLLRSSQRRHVRRGRQEAWHSFFADSSGLLTGGFGPLVAFDELKLRPGESIEAHSDSDAEVLTYVYKGALSQEDTAGNSYVIPVGEFQRMSTARGVRHRETSVSRFDWAHIFRISLRPPEPGQEREHAQKRFTEAQRRNLLCVVASPDGRKGSLQFHQDVVVFSAILDAGHHLVHELTTDRSAWLHVVHGEATFRDLVLTLGDAVGVEGERSMSLTVQEDSEVLLVDLGPKNSRH